MSENNDGNEDNKPSLPYKGVDPKRVPKSESGMTTHDLYVRLPIAKKFIKWISKGEKLQDTHIEKIFEHADPKFYTESEIEEDKDFIVEPEPATKDAEDKIIKGEKENVEFARLTVSGKKGTPNPDTEVHVFKVEHSIDSIKEVFGEESAAELAKPIDEDLKKVFSSIELAKPGSINLHDTEIEELSEKITETIAPGINDVREHLKNIPSLMGIMDDAAAISTLAILFAIAQGQKNKGVFKDLSYAALMMDIGLTHVSEDIRKQWFTNPDAMSDADKAIFESHPRKAQAICMEKFKNLPEIVGQMILGHHELFSGRGFPRKLRSDLLPPIVRILALAVDVHYEMKKAEFAGETKNLEEVLSGFIDTSIEPHLRRHNVELCKKIEKYMIEGDPDV